MNEQKKVGRTGRPTQRTETYKRTTIELPENLLDTLAEHLGEKRSRSSWVIEAIREKLEREQGEK